MKLYYYDNYKTNNITSNQLLQCVLKKVIGKKYNFRKPTIQKQLQGKPYISNYEGIYFNISHVDNMWCCIVDNQEIGFDIEKNNTLFSSKIITRYFTEKEQKYIEKQSDDIKNKTAYIIWNMKEAYAKFFGKSIFNVLVNSEMIACDGFCKKLIHKGVAIRFHINRERNLNFIDTEYTYAIATKKKHIDIEMEKISDEYIRNCYKIFGT